MLFRPNVPLGCARLNQKHRAAPSHVNLPPMVCPPLFNFKQAVRDTSTQAPPYCVSSYYLPTSSTYLCMSRLFLLSQCVIFRHLPCAPGGVSWSKHLQGNLNFQNCTIIIARPKKCMLVKGLLMKCLGLLTFNDLSSQADTRLLLGPVRFPECRAPVCLFGSVSRLKGRWTIKSILDQK